MSDTSTPTLDEAVAKAKEHLSEADQAAAAAELDFIVDELAAVPERPPEVQAEILRRVSKPLKIVPREEVDALFDRYDPSACK